MKARHLFAAFVAGGVVGSLLFAASMASAVKSYIAFLRGSDEVELTFDSPSHPWRTFEVAHDQEAAPVGGQ